MTDERTLHLHPDHSIIPSNPSVTYDMKERAPYATSFPRVCRFLSLRTNLFDVDSPDIRWTTYEGYNFVHAVMSALQEGGEAFGFTLDEVLEYLTDEQRNDQGEAARTAILMAQFPEKYNYESLMVQVFDITDPENIISLIPFGTKRHRQKQTYVYETVSVEENCVADPNAEFQKSLTTLTWNPHTKTWQGVRSDYLNYSDVYVAKDTYVEYLTSIVKTDILMCRGCNTFNIGVGQGHVTNVYGYDYRSNIPIALLTNPESLDEKIEPKGGR